MTISPYNYRDEYFACMSQAVHRAFKMREKAKGYASVPVIAYMKPLPIVNSVAFIDGNIDPDLVYTLEREEDAIYLILKYDQS